MTFNAIRNTGLIILVIILMVMGLVPTLIIINISKHNDDLIHEINELKEVFSLNTQLRNAGSSFDQKIKNSEEDFSEVIASLDNIISSSKELEKKLNEETEDHKKMNNVKALIKEARRFRLAVRNYSMEVAYDPASDNASQLEQVVLETEKKASDIFSEFLTDTYSELRIVQNSINTIIKAGQKTSLIGLALGVISGVLVAFLLGRYLSRYISQVVKGMERVSKGDLDFKVEVADSDELYQLALAFNRMTEQLKISIEKEHLITQELLESNQALKKSLQAKSDFLSNMSHELRTPLNHIIGFTDLVASQDAGPLNETQIEYLNDVLTSGNHLLSMINDTLDFSRLEAGKMSLDLSETNVHHLLHRGLNIVKDKAIKNSIQLSIAHNSVTPETITADERVLKQVMYNLLANAIKFTPEHGRVIVSAKIVDRNWLRTNIPPSFREEMRSVLQQPDQPYLKISVADTGIGLKQESLLKIFDEFHQEENPITKKYEGTGLGLAICKKYLKLHKGSIWVESIENKGSTFSFVVPVS